MSLPSDKKRKIFDGRYEIISIVGRGADSVVYRARHTTGAAQEVAIKVLVNRGSENSLTDKLRKEALTLVSCRHKYVVRLDDFHSIKDLCYLSMEYAPLGDLVKYSSNTDNKLSTEQVEIFLRQTLEALDFVHATGVIHRDLKPENILVVGEREIRLADFGLALLPGDEVQLEELRNAVGTFDYLAPETLDGVRYDTLSDLYSLGVCFYEVATGVHPFRNVPLARQQEVRRDGAIQPIEELVPTLNPNIAAVISTLMRFSAQDRFQSASDALQAVRDKNFRVSGTAQHKAVAEDTPVVASQSVVGQRTSQAVARSEDSGVSSPHVGEAGSAATAMHEPVVAAPPQDKHTPANDDVVSNRSTNRTEKIDLERVKEIIARDSRRKTLSPLERPESTPAKNSDPLASAQSMSSRVSDLKTAQRASSKEPLRTSLISSFLNLSTGAKSGAVALSSALITIGVLLCWNMLFQPSGGGTSVPPQKVKETDAPSGQSSVTDEKQAPSELSGSDLRSLPSGFYSGSIRGLLPPGDIPLAIISQPNFGGTVLVLGVEGWLPTTETEAAKGSDTASSIFRSNGLILQFNREMSSDKITGTVVDMVTGDSGTWSIEKTS